MSTYNFLHSVSVAGIRDYLINHRVDAGDSLILNTSDYESIFNEVKSATEDPVDFPLTILNVIIARDNTGSVPAGKIQIVKNESTQQ